MINDEDLFSILPFNSVSLCVLDPKVVYDCYVNKGMSQRAIASLLGCHPKTVKKTMERLGIKAREYKRNPLNHTFTYEELYDLYIVKKMDQLSIAEMFQVSRPLVSKYLRMFGIPTRGNHRPVNNKTMTLYQSKLASFYRMYQFNATTRNYAFELSLERFEEIIKLPCRYCGQPPSQKRGRFLFGGIDRLDNTLGYVEGNVCPCCGPCNLSKGTRSEQQFIQWVLRTSKHLQSTMISRQDEQVIAELTESEVQG